MATELATRPAMPALYERFAAWYDAIYRHGLQPGRDRAIARLHLTDGDSVLEVGTGTGLSALGYPRRCRVVAVDLSGDMLRRARARLVEHRATHVRLCQMDGFRLAFPDETFDAVYAPYFINTVPDPAAVAREMVRVCKCGGRVVFLNHFREPTPSLVDRVVGQFATRVSGVSWTLDLERLLDGLPLLVRSIDKVNLAEVSSVVCCVKRPDAASRSVRSTR